MTNLLQRRIKIFLVPLIFQSIVHLFRLYLGKKDRTKTFFGHTGSLQSPPQEQVKTAVNPQERVNKTTELLRLKIGSLNNNKPVPCRIKLFLNLVCYERMNGVIQYLQFIRIRKNELSQLRPVYLPVFFQKLLSEKIYNLPVSVPSGLVQFADHGIGINKKSPFGLKKPAGQGFAGPHVSANAENKPGHSMDIRVSPDP
ncbi:MAG TPA: hypothetical protein VI588_03000 [Candidatus Gracilibacteria bacterium]|nr:hypothetical protein [Candidatus Gracilibacteria bacterium]